MKESVFKVEALGDLLIGITTAGQISDSDWTEFINNLKRPEIKKYIGTVVGAGEANSIQRKSASEVFKVRKIPAVVITESSIVRGIVTAVSWWGANIKSYDWPELRKGLEHLDVTGLQQDRAVIIIQRMKATYG